MKSKGLSVLLLAAALAPPAACGKKGPPLPPFVRVPAAVDHFAARRIGSTVYVQFTVPAKNQDNSTPADIARVDVYGLTGTAETPEDVLKYGTLVGTVLVRRPPSPDEEDRAREKEKVAAGREDKTKDAPQPKPGRKPPEPEPGFDQGAEVTLTETVTPALSEPSASARQARDRKKTDAGSHAPILLPLASAAAVPSRVYVAVGVSRKGRRGSTSPLAPIPLLDLPAPPGAVKLSHSETAITIQWTPPPGAPLAAVATVPADSPGAERGVAAVPAVEPGAAQGAAATDVPPLPSTPRPSRGAPEWSYQVYEAPPPGRTNAAAAGGQPASAPMAPPPAVPTPLNGRPLTATTFADSRIEFGTERCYAVRAVKTIGPLSEEGEPSEVACITPRDVYPPAAPKGLTAVVNAGAISLIWDPNAESDLDGYLVLRAEAPNGTLQPITREPIHETTFNDTSVKAGARYVYAIVAVDKARNASPPSARVEETAR